MSEICFVVDDEPIEAMAVEMILKEQFPDLAVYRVTSGRKALETMEIVKPDLFIVDIHMPGINGLELIRVVKEDFPRVRVLIISAYDTFEYAQEAIRLGARQYLLKPARREEIAESVRALLAEIREEKRQRKEQYIHREKWELSSPYLEREWLHALIRGEGSGGEFDKLTELLDLRHCTGLFVVIETERERLPSLVKELKSLWSSRYPRVLETSLEQRLVFLILCHPQEHMGAMEENVERELIKFREKAGELFWGIGGVAQTPEQLAASYQKAVSELGGAGGEQDLKRKIERFLQSGYRRDIKIEEAARTANLSVHYFSKWFKKQFGKNFSEYLLELRLNDAIRLLEQTKMSVKEISYQIGFNDPNYFSKIFKKYTGKNPNKFRRWEHPQ